MQRYMPFMFFLVKYLHKLHDWYRVKEMEPPEAILPLNHTGDLSDGQGGGVGGKHGGAEGEDRGKGQREKQKGICV